MKFIAYVKQIMDVTYKQITFVLVDKELKNTPHNGVHGITC